MDHTVFPGVPYLICSIQEFCGCFLLHPVDSLYKALTTHMLAPSPHSHRHLLRGSWLFMCNGDGDHSIENARVSGAGGVRERRTEGRKAKYYYIETRPPRRPRTGGRGGMTTIIIQYWGKVEWRRKRRESRRSVWRRMARPYITWEFLWALSTKEEINLLCLPQPLPPPLSATAYSALLHYRPPALVVGGN